jgi:hypothetical protein
MTVSKPLCCICFREPRAEGSARCLDCGPGRIRPVGPPSYRRPVSAAQRAAEQLGNPDACGEVVEP